MQLETYIIALLFVIIVLFVRNLRTMEEIAEYTARVKRKLNTLAMQYEYVRRLNDTIRSQAQGDNFSIVQAPAAPPYDRIG